MSYATYQDANIHLDGTKIEFTDAADAVPEAIKADRVVRARLNTLYSAYLPDWDADTTPEIVNLAASMLMASYRYAKRYSEESLDGNDYAARLEMQAEKLLDGLSSGMLSLADKPDIAFIGSLWEGDFLPNDTTVVEDALVVPTGLTVGDPLRYFTMDRAF